MEQFLKPYFLFCIACMPAIFLLGCGGGGGDSGSPSSSAASSDSSLSSSLSIVSSSSMTSSSQISSSSGLSNSQRADAANQTAENNASCAIAKPFYWEIGDHNEALASGSVGGTTYNATTVMAIASASKWIFGAYVVQLREGQLSADDISSLTMSSGYTNFDETSCLRLLPENQTSETVADCFHSASSSGGNDSDFNAAALGKFYYNGGHFQKMAMDLGLAGANSLTLQQTIQAQLGTDFVFSYWAPQLAGGVMTSAANYAVFLRKIINNQLVIHDLLGSHSVCTNVTTCVNSLYTPVPAYLNWDYSLAHWVENDPVVGDGAFSSPGAFGFYPWINANKTLYGVLARLGAPGGGEASALCGALIRKAWTTGVAQ